MLRDGAKYRTVAARFGVSVTSLHRWATNAGIVRKPRLSPEMITKVRSLVADGLSINAVSRATGVSWPWVRELTSDMSGPRTVAKPVRCECGALVTVVPCIACQARAHAKGCATRRAG